MPARPYSRRISPSQGQRSVHGLLPHPTRDCARNPFGFSMLELTVVLLIAGILAAFAIPVVDASMTSLRLNSTTTAMSSAISNTRYRAIKDSQIYTLVLTTPANTYVVKNTATGATDPLAPLPYPAIALNGATSTTYTFTLCPNGTVYGAGGACPGNSAPPTIAATYQGKETDISVSSAGNVTTKTIH